MNQNLYDDPAFFQGYSQFPRSEFGLSRASEWPRLQAMLPSLTGTHVVDLGCGFGYFARWAHESGAQSILGIDLSERMLERARALTQDQAITYQQASLEDLSLPAAAFDLAYSSLAFHYVENLPVTIARVYQSLKPGGHLVFSVEHPLYTAPTEPGWVQHSQGQDVWPVDRYLEEGPRITDWITPGVIKYHRSIATYVNLLLQSGFRLLRMEEWGPNDQELAEHPEWALERSRPPFLLLSAIVPLEKS